jgi:hypothetical protein
MIIIYKSREAVKSFVIELSFGPSISGKGVLDGAV